MRSTSVLFALAALVFIAALSGTAKGEEGKNPNSIIIHAGTGARPIFNGGYTDGFPPLEVIIFKKDGSVYIPHKMGNRGGHKASKPATLLARSSWGKIKLTFNGETASPLAKKPGGGGSSETVLLDLEDGMLTTDLPMNVVTDSRRKIHLDTHAFSGTMNFTNPGDWFQIKGNSKQPDITQEEGDALLAELGKVVDNGSFYMEIGKTGLEPGGVTSGGHFLILNYVGVLGDTGIQIGGPYGTPVTVEWLSHTETVDIFQFTGTVIVGKRGGGRKDSYMIGCPGVGPEPNKVVVTVTR